MLLWLDMEMTGLNPACDKILEIAMIVTDDNLKQLATGPNLVIHQSDETLAKMDVWNTRHHMSSGLIELARKSQVTEAEAEAKTIAFIDAHFPTGKLRPMLAGNSIHQDRRFIDQYMPTFGGKLHYRMVDVSAIGEMAKRWQPDLMSRMPGKCDTHRALPDIYESIAEMKFYKKHIFRD